METETHQLIRRANTLLSSGTAVGAPRAAPITAASSCRSAEARELRRIPSGNVAAILVAVDRVDRGGQGRARVGVAVGAVATAAAAAFRGVGADRGRGTQEGRAEEVVSHHGSSDGKHRLLTFLLALH